MNSPEKKPEVTLIDLLKIPKAKNTPTLRPSMMPNISDLRRYIADQNLISDIRNGRVKPPIGIEFVALDIDAKQIYTDPKKK